MILWRTKNGKIRMYKNFLKKCVLIYFILNIIIIFFYIEM